MAGVPVKNQKTEQCDIRNVNIIVTGIGTQKLLEAIKNYLSRRETASAQIPLEF
jgi:ABC-type enterobactin transport system permease subunit